MTIPFKRTRALIHADAGYVRANGSAWPASAESERSLRKSLRKCCVQIRLTFARRAKGWRRRGENEVDK